MSASANRAGTPRAGIRPASGPLYLFPSVWFQLIPKEAWRPIKAKHTHVTRTTSQLRVSTQQPVTAANRLSLPSYINCWPWSACCCLLSLFSLPCACRAAATHSYAFRDSELRSDVSKNKADKQGRLREFLLLEYAAKNPFYPL